MGQALKKELRVKEGQDFLSVYRWNTQEAEHYFCKNCGIYTHHVMRGATEYVGVNMACIEGFDVFAIDDVAVGGGSKLSIVPKSAA